MKLVGGRSLPDTSQDAMRSDSCSLGAWLRLLTKKELLGLLFDFFGRTLHASWKQKSCFVMFAP